MGVATVGAEHRLRLDDPWDPLAPVVDGDTYVWLFGAHYPLARCYIYGRN